MKHNWIYILFYMEICKSESGWKGISPSCMLINYRVSFHVKPGEPFSTIFKGMETPYFRQSLEGSISPQTSVFCHFERLSLPNLVSQLGSSGTLMQWMQRIGQLKCMALSVWGRAHGHLLQFSLLWMKVEELMAQGCSLDRGVWGKGKQSHHLGISRWLCPVCAVLHTVCLTCNDNHGRGTDMSECPGNTWAHGTSFPALSLLQDISLPFPGLLLSLSKHKTEKHFCKLFTQLRSWTSLGFKGIFLSKVTTSSSRQRRNWGVWSRVLCTFNLLEVVGKKTSSRVGDTYFPFGREMGLSRIPLSALLFSFILWLFHVISSVVSGARPWKKGTLLTLIFKKKLVFFILIPSRCHYRAELRFFGNSNKIYLYLDKTHVQGNPKSNTRSKSLSTCTSTFYNILAPILADDLLTISELLKIESLWYCF